MEPRVLKRERKLQLNYDLPHRVRCALVYPVTAPNGSSLVLLGHNSGVTLLFRGGRRVKQRTAQQPTPQSNPKDVVMIDESEEESQPNGSTQMQYEEEEDETDPETPYPSIIQELELNLGSAVLHVAAPTLAQQTSQRPAIVKHHAIVAVHTADGKVSLLQIPMAPPYPTTTRDAVESILNDRIELPAGKAALKDISVKVQTRFPKELSQLRTSEPETSICVAAVSDALRIWRFPTSADEIIVEETTLQRLPLLSNANKVSFHPSSGSAQALIVDSQSAVRIYDPSAPKDPNARPSSSDYIPAHPGETGKWIMTFQAPYHVLPRDHPAVPARKKILDAKWILGGRAIMALLEDGEWVIWGVSSSVQNNTSGGQTIFHGFLGSSGAAAPADSGSQSKGSSKLAPMTPNTRKTKSQNFFSGAPKAPGAVSRGGISVAGTDNLHGEADGSVMLWYDSDVYAIPNFQLFWQRISNVASNGLYTPGLSHISDINLMNENITSISQFSAKSSASGLGHMNTARDFLVSTEHRFIIHQTTRPPVPSKGLFDKFTATTSAPSDRDQRMLDAGELDIGGMDRLLDSMANGGANRPRKVGFAAS